MPEHILSLSYGKDSLACLFAIEELGWPLDRIVHAEVWATDAIPADPPPMVEFKAKADKIIKERWGIEVEHLCATKDGEKLTYEKLFYHVPKRKESTAEKFKGGYKGFRQLPDRGATGTSSDPPCGWPCQRSSWCKKLKDGTYPRLPHHQGTVMHKRSQTPGFLRSPHGAMQKIPCNISA